MAARQSQGSRVIANDGYRPQTIDKVYADTLLNTPGGIQTVENQKMPKSAVFHTYQPKPDTVAPTPGNDFKGRGGR